MGVQVRRMKPIPAYRVKLLKVLSTTVLVLLAGCSGLTPERIQNCIVTNRSGGVSFNLLALAERPANTRHVAPNTCAFSALHVVLRHWGAQLTKPELARILPDPGQMGYSLGALQNAAKHLGFGAFAVSSSVEELAYHTRKGRPCVIFYEVRPGMNHAIVVWAVGECQNDIDIGGRQVLIQDRDDPCPKWVTGATILGQWDALDAPMLLIARILHPLPSSMQPNRERR